MLNAQTVEGIKQFIRIALSGAVSYLLTGGVLQTLLQIILGSKLDPSVIVILTGLLTSILSGWDKINHENGNTSPLDMNKGFLDGLKE